MRRICPVANLTINLYKDVTSIFSAEAKRKLGRPEYIGCHLYMNGYWPPPTLKAALNVDSISLMVNGIAVLGVTISIL